MRLTLFCLIALLFAACGDASTDSQTSASEESTPAQSTEQPAAPSEGAKYTLTPFDKSTEFPNAKLESMSFEDGNWAFEISGDYTLGEQTPDAGGKGCANSSQGQHIHLIADVDPYVAKYEPEFKHDIADGKRAVLAFLSRSYHESIKTPDAYIAKRLYIMDGMVQREFDIEESMLFYSRPKGVYEGDDTKKVMLDYYMVNCDPDKHWVRADINGEIHDLKVWQPYYIEGLPAGDNVITLTLMDDNGIVRTDYNPVSRTFKLNPEPAQN